MAPFELDMHLGLKSSFLKKNYFEPQQGDLNLVTTIKALSEGYGMR